jgi:hypothetical protein
MDSRPVELTRQLVASLNRRDLDEIVPLLGPECVCDFSAFGLATHTGPDAIHGFAVEWFGGLYEFGTRVQEMRDFGNGIVYAATVAHRARGPSGFVELPGEVVLAWQDGLLTGVTVYASADEALADAERLAEERA